MKKILTFTFILFISINICGQKKKKDTLFFKYDENYIIKSNFNNNELSIKDSGSIESFIFEKSDTLLNLNPKNILCLKKYIRSSKFYRKNAKRKLNDYALYSFFNNYIIFFIKNNMYIRVYSTIMIE